MYNVLSKVCSGEVLTLKERNIHEQGLVSVLRQIHDELDAAVLDAYGWPQAITDNEILQNLAALSQERAREEAAGTIRWLRPEFQKSRVEKPTGPAVVKTKQPQPAPAERQAWPKDLSGQIAAIRRVVTHDVALTAAEIIGAFKKAPRKEVLEILESLQMLGKVIAHNGGNPRWTGADRLASVRPPAHAASSTG